MRAPGSSSPLGLPLLFAAGASALALLLPRLFPLPPLTTLDGLQAEGLRLEFPLGYDLLLPLSWAADRITLMSVPQLKVLAAALFLLLAWAAWAGARGPLRRLELERAAARAAAWAGCGLAMLVAFLLWGALASRPSARLAAAEEGTLILDFHSHTQASWDGRRGWDGRASAQWHERLGFNAGFITDHNVTEEALAAAEWSEADRRRGKVGFRVLRGEELSLERMHLVVLGNRTPIDNRPYHRGPEGIRDAIRLARSQGAATLASLPEYWRHHMDRIADFADWGLDGFEVVNGSPKALAFPRKELDRVLDLAGSRNMAAVCASDSHGWGSAVPCWNVARIRDWRDMDLERLEAAVIRALKQGPTAVRPILRARPAPESPWALALDPLAQSLLCLRTATPRQALFLGLWVLAAAWLWLHARPED